MRVHRALAGLAVPGLPGCALDAPRVDGIAQLLGRLEEGDPFGRHIDALAGLGIAANTRVTLASAEAAKAAYLDLVTGFEGTDD